jgi:tetratricopeptide (TPR) repeat protein
MSINTTSGLLFYLVRQFDLGLEQSLKTIDLDPNFFASHFVCGLCYEEKGMHAEAVAEFQKAAELSGRWPLFIAALGHGWATAGNRLEAEKLIGELQDPSRKRYRASYSIAAIHAGLGERQAALEWLEKACEERGTWMIFLKVHPYWDFLRAEPRFTALLDQLKLDSPPLGAAS